MWKPRLREVKSLGPSHTARADEPGLPRQSVISGGHKGEKNEGDRSIVFAFFIPLFGETVSIYFPVSFAVRCSRVPKFSSVSLSAGNLNLLPAWTIKHCDELSLILFLLCQLDPTGDGAKEMV